MNELRRLKCFLSVVCACYLNNDRVHTVYGGVNMLVFIDKQSSGDPVPRIDR